MSENNVKQKKYLLVAASVILLAISVWAFVQQVKMERTGNRDWSASQAQTQKQGAKQKETEKKFDAETAAKNILEQVSFDTKLNRMDDSVTKSMIVSANDSTKMKLYMGDGTSADELLIVECSSEENVPDEVEAVQKHLQEMQQSFQDYLPKEAKKIDDTVILQSGKVIIACVTGDVTKAQKIIREQLE